MDDAELREIEVRYFHLALEEWQSVRDALHTSWREALGAGRIPLIWGGVGGLNDAVSEINRLARTLRGDVLAKGFHTVDDIKDTLGQVAQNYVINFAQSEEEAAKLEGMLENGS